ncbi:d-alanyl-D-alanine carboxypeptidase [Firmicutes bacterium CAG:822]|nr:d-alanyl-D-alanine carboxypeptidase [Firmicutes bacterium CAG:822]
MKKVLALIIGVLLIYLVYYLQKPYIYSSVDPISEINPLILVNSENAFPDNVNLNLVSFNGYQVADTIYNDLARMYNAALNDNITLKINNAYRSKDEQNQIFESKMNAYENEGYTKEKAYEQTTLTVQVPGYSEHETGLAIDFSNEGHYDENEKMWEWLKNNAYKYGFILRYPEDKYEITKINYEPWHYRYVGKKAAKDITNKNLTLEEYLGGNV